jgi:hypothetical protein
LLPLPVREGDHNLERSLKDPRKIQQVFDAVCFTGTIYRWMLSSYVSSAANSNDLAAAAAS